MNMANDWLHEIIITDKNLVEYIKIEECFVKDLTQQINSLSKHLKKCTQQASIDRIEERLNELEEMRIKEIRHHRRLCKELKDRRETIRDLIYYLNSIEI